MRFFSAKGYFLSQIIVLYEIIECFFRITFSVSVCIKAFVLVGGFLLIFYFLEMMFDTKLWHL
jgi:hypothetical protein